MGKWKCRETENVPLSHASDGPFKNATPNANIFVYRYVTNKCEHLQFVGINL